jgi:hypothetical protein
MAPAQLDELAHEPAIYSAKSGGFGSCRRAPIGRSSADATLQDDDTLPRGDVAIDLGIGYGHAPFPGDPNRSIGGFGMNLEIAGGVTNELELGLRLGERFDADGRTTRADAYARPFDTETYGTRTDHLANPELRMRWTVARGATAQLGLEARAYLPTEAGSRFGFMLAVPVALRLGIVRIDTGLYVPVLLYDPTETVVSIPAHVWIQASPTFWLGPLFGVRVQSPGGHDAFPFGFGIGSALSRQIDFRAWFLFPDLNGDAAARTFGAGVALEARFE